MNYLSPWVQMTNRCNLRCKYCFVDYDDKEISLNDYNVLFNYFSNILKSKKLEYLKFRISGGEPLLVFNKWYDLLEKFLSDNVNAYAEILTNFTICNDNIIDFLIRNEKIGLNISLDSVIESKHFKNGKSSSSIVMNNIEKIKQYKDIFIMTVITDSGIHLPKLSEYIIENNFKWEIQFNKYYENNLNKNILMNSLDKVLNNIKNSNFDILNNLLFNFCDFKQVRMCEAGYRMCFVDTNLDIHSCQMNKDKLPITNIKNNDVIEKLNLNKKEFNNNKYNECDECIINKYCHGDCKINNIDKRKLSYFCDVMKYYVINFGDFVLEKYSNKEGLYNA